MQSFAQRVDSDSDRPQTELYRDPSGDHITALSVYLTAKTGGHRCNWIEIAYGTRSGAVRVIVQHPETVGHRPQPFQTFTVHQSPVTRVTLSETLLVSVCADRHHVRTWRLTRFRGTLAAQPATMATASFQVCA